MRLGLLTSLAALFGTSSAGQTYQTMKPVTRKNIGRNRLKSISRYAPHQGEQECARRLRQWKKIEARRAAQ
jgi:hypothetical protein